MNGSQELLPCPFCGGEVKSVYCSCAHEVRCKPCDLIFPIHGCENKMELAKKWNTRWADKKPRTSNPQISRDGGKEVT